VSPAGTVRLEGEHVTLLVAGVILCRSDRRTNHGEFPIPSTHRRRPRDTGHKGVPDNNVVCHCLTSAASVKH